MRIHLMQSFAHLRPELRPLHGPQIWPWWKLMSFGPCRLDCHAPTSGYRLWVYTRWGAWFADIYFDRRPRPL